MSNSTRNSDSLSVRTTQILSEEAYTIFTIVDVVILSEIVSLFGMFTNSITIIVLVRQGFRKSINVSLAGLAVSDFLSLVSLVCLCVGNNPWLIQADVSFDPIGVFYLTTGWPNTIFARITGWITAYITLERCLCVAMPLKIKRVLTRNTSLLILVIIYIGVIAGVCPIYFTTGLHWRYDAAKNRSIIGLNFIGANREDIKRVALAITNVFSPFTSFGLVIICTAILGFKLTEKSNWRNSVTRIARKVKGSPEKTVSKEKIISQNDVNPNNERANSCNENGNAAKVVSPVSKDAKVIKLVVVLSSIYIISSIPAVVHFVWMILDPQYTVVGLQSNVHISVAGITFLFQAANSSANLFTYIYMSSSFRIEFYKLRPFKKCSPHSADDNMK
ncbi:uncharacterized protein LOC106059664 [Biomphalaria glabrata]|uniref:Uncharacterized protein LOC106059664 n=1 Tax=Biomphalaria glabrata TaxID=6526 RepID=A0A9U8E4Q2_BIOGL|nr:uncharacterized protein LOC106059664 [Biomphalaria glabrata]